jgi:5-hydroxyisourate hydrolase-like protein (transthyretin family)
MSRSQFLARGSTAAAVALTSLILIAALASVAFAVPGTVTGITSSTHPSETTWYSNNNPSFAWEPALSDGTAISGYSCVLDRSFETVPDTLSDRNSLTYLPRVAYTVGGRPAEARIVDVSGDGKPDLVVENYNSNTLSILLGNGDGTLKAKVDYATAEGPWSMAIGDVNGDGKTDVVTCNYTASSASVFTSNGNGTFKARADYTTGTGTNPECLRMGDVDGDGDLDIFTANASTNNVSILLNNGNGTFKAPTTFSTATHPTSIDLCDLNGDGKQDLATANYSAGSVSVLMGKGNGTFQTAVNYAASGNPQMVLAADLDRDGKPDLSTVNWGSNNASILLNNGNGTFKTAVNYAIGNGPYAFSVIDLNQDSAPDLVTTNNTAGSVSILYGNGDGTFDPRRDLATGSGPCFVALGDLNGDGYGDMITTDMNDNTVSVFRGTAFLGASYTGKADGEWYFHVRAVNSAGIGGPTTTRRLRIDVTAPTTSDSSGQALAADGDSAWRQTGQTVTLEAADVSSGLAHTYYTLDGEQHDYEGPFTVDGDGSHAITYWSTDIAGNRETAHSGYVNVWGTAPTTSANAVVSTTADEGWRTSDPQTVSLTATGGHGPVAVHSVLDGGAQADAAGEATFDVAGDGSHELEYWATDELGNEETHHAVHVNIDTVAPVTTDDYAGGSAWQTGPVSFSLTANDATSGVDGTTWTVDGGAPQSGTDVTVTGDGEHTVTYLSTDVAGNAEDENTVTVCIDAGAPETADDAPAGWRNADTTVTLTPTDALSGIIGGLATTTWELDGGATQTGTSVLVAAPSDHSGDGARAITYRSTDAAGNREAGKTATVLVDTLAPTTRDDLASGPPAHTDPVTVTLSASDDNAPLDVSGVAATYFRVDDGPWQTGTAVEVTGDGEHTVSYYSTDNAGNDEAVRTSSTLTIATTPPGASSDDAPGGWANHAVSVTLTPGVRALRTTWELDGGASTPGTSVAVAAPADHSRDGAHVVTYRSWAFGDVAEPTRTAIVRIDTRAPQTSDNAPAGWHSGAVTLTLSPSDAASGIAGTTWTLDGGAVQRGTSVPVTGDGTHTVTYSSTDNAGNAEATRTATVRIDGTAPQASCAEAGRWFKKTSVSATVAASDAASGVAKVEYRLGQGGWQQGTTAVVTGAGAHPLSYRVTDVCGNVTTGECVVGIDTARPKTVKAFASKGKKSGKLTLAFKVTDAKPGCGAATVSKIVVTTAKGKKVATIKGIKTVVKTNAKVRLVVKKKLKKGVYRFTVSATDIAGNKSKKATPAILVVK